MIEEIIHNQIDSFNSEGLSDGHFERFEQKLNMAFPVVQKNKPIMIFMMAASIILFISAITIFLIKSKNNITDKQIHAKTNPEIFETEQYYLNTISEKINILNKKQIITSDLTTDLKEIDKNIKNLSKEIVKNPGDERLISAVINTYQIKADLLDDIIAHTR
jgi:hypothetical protein